MTVRGALSVFGFVAYHLQEARAQLLFCHADNEAKMKGSWFVTVGQHAKTMNDACLSD